MNPTPEQIERLAELKSSIEELCLGSVEAVVIAAAQEALLDNWDDHNSPSNETHDPLVGDAETFPNTPALDALSRFPNAMAALPDLITALEDLANSCDEYAAAEDGDIPDTFSAWESLSIARGVKIFVVG